MAQNAMRAVPDHEGPWPTTSSLPGKTVTLEKLKQAHVQDLWDVAGGKDNAHLWEYLAIHPMDTFEEFEKEMIERSNAKDYVLYAIIDNARKRTVGHLCLMRIDQKNRVIEVGGILFASCLQRTKQATETMYVLAKYVFEDLGYRRYEWKCDSLNSPSRRAAERFGFQFEGTFRQHMIFKGRNRDTCWFSICDSEWPAVKKGYEMWLDDDNFDQEGNQISTLEDCRHRAQTEVQ